MLPLGCRPTSRKNAAAAPGRLQCQEISKEKSSGRSKSCTRRIPERADATVFGRRTGLDRRGFLGGAGLAAVGAAVGGAIPFAANMPGGLIPAALAQSAPAAARRRAKRTAVSEISRQGRQARAARRSAAGGRDAGASAGRGHHADPEVLRAQQWANPGRDQGARQVEDHDRRRGQQQARSDARRIEVEVQAGHAAHGA